MRTVLVFLGGMLTGAAAGWLFIRKKDVRRNDYFHYALHELNNSVTGAQLTVKNFLLGIFGEIPRGHLKWMEMLEDHMERLSYMIADFKDFVTLEFDGKPKPATEKVDITGIARALEEKYRSVSTRTDIRLDLVLPGSPVFAECEAAAAERILSNLLERCFQLSPKSATVTLSVKDGPSSDVLVSVEHGGVHMISGHRAAALKWMSSSRDFAGGRMYAGPGLGLGLSRKLARLNGGDLSIAERQGGGEILFFRIKKAI